VVSLSNRKLILHLFLDIDIRKIEDVITASGASFYLLAALAASLAVVPAGMTAFILSR
jgi:hypothetical protein